LEVLEDNDPETAGVCITNEEGRALECTFHLIPPFLPALCASDWCKRWNRGSKGKKEPAAISTSYSRFLKFGAEGEPLNILCNINKLFIFQ
jgi:hypothetical protein